MYVCVFSFDGLCCLHLCVLVTHGKSANTGCKLLYSITITAVSYMQGQTAGTNWL